VIGLDTNVLVRHATQDDPKQSAAAERLLSSLSEETPGFVSLITMVESVWVLQRAYHAPSEVVVQFVTGLLNAREIRVQSPDIVRQSIRLLETGGGDFSDAVIALLGAEAGCDETVTFDRNASNLPGMRLLT
jgi:predicted nucleic-acid-binding protein